MTLQNIVGSQLRRSRHWANLRRLQHEGLPQAFSRWLSWMRILETSPISTDEVRDGAPVEVHVLCYERDYLCAMWALKSFYHFAQVSYPLMIHLQGRTTRRMIARMRRHFPSAHIVSQTRADALVENWLREHGMNRLLAMRRLNPFMLKLTDFSILGKGVHLLTFDSDLVFFQQPSELLIATDEPLPVSVFQRDPRSAYNISEDRAYAELGVRLAPQVNTGIMLFPRGSLDLARCESYLAHPEVARSTGFIEQTLHALCASEQDRVTYLPDSYLVSVEQDVDLTPLVARHYAGHTRRLFTTEGIPWLIRADFIAQACAGQPPSERALAL